MIPCVMTVLCTSLILHAAAPESRVITDLVQQRVKTLEQLVALTTQQYRTGQASIDDYLSAENSLLEARIGLAADQPSRIELLGKLVDNLKKMEALVRERVASGVASTTDHLRAKAARLQAEIDLARESERGEPPE